MEELAEQTIGEMVAENYRTATVFKKHGIDFCCKGGRSLVDACLSKGIDPEPVISDLEEIANIKDDSGVDYTTWELDRLADHIEDKHHRYVEAAIEQLIPFIDKVSKVHGDRHPELIAIRELFFAATGNLTQHMKKEELILFPFVRKMVKAKRDGIVLDNPSFGTVQNPIAMMKDEHEAEGERFEKISELSNGFTPPEDACSTYQVSFALLKEFQDDLHKHIHLENNILFPKALELEASRKKV